MVYFRKEFLKAYKQCPLNVRKQFRERLQLFLEDSYHPLLRHHALRGEWKGLRSINVTGDYRAIFCYADNENVEFFTIDTHSNLYG